MLVIVKPALFKELTKKKGKWMLEPNLKEENELKIKSLNESIPLQLYLNLYYIFRDLFFI